MAAGGFRHALTQSSANVRAEQPLPVWVQLRERVAAAERQGRARWSCRSLRPRQQQASDVTCRGAKVTSLNPKATQTTFPRVTQMAVCAAQGRRLDPGVALALPRRRAWEGGWGGGLPRRLPSPHAPLFGDKPRVSLGRRGRCVTGTAGRSFTLTF